MLGFVKVSGHSKGKRTFWPNCTPLFFLFAVGLSAGSDGRVLGKLWASKPHFKMIVTFYFFKCCVFSLFASVFASFFFTYLAGA